jgi:hypothetical protein
LVRSNLTVPVQFEETAYVPVKGSVAIAPSRDAVVSPVNVPVDGSNVIWFTAAVAGLPLLSVPPCRNPFATQRGVATSRAQAAELSAKVARTIIDAMRNALDIMVLSSSLF